MLARSAQKKIRDPPELRLAVMERLTLDLFWITPVFTLHSLVNICGHLTARI